ncbi:MAG TPA: hypothetical protein VMZ25_04305, partial [Terriglobales bacterium]|nr:hypothetical protein [Terriglobales bacterium]
LSLTHDGREFSFPIARGSSDLVDSALRKRFADDGLLPVNRAITIRELQSLPAFDPALQSAMLSDVDKMILELYGITAQL